ncbi:MAG TPA: chemotaxis response regulator protein-glutamate methylesterase [Candidatus Binatia bacterium]|nr:chemotaxis response regulator protein-glutamate methylesterase [Candidatus Sulfotelmatobacter sp.]HXJ85963.1 chemotaxis response regulator protein-glutamate methylesterase [Candidatus Binatia bacterium]
MPPVRVLVVDDSVVVRKLLSEALASTPGIQLAGTASSGALALAKIPQLNPEVITLDIEMPGLNGIQTLQEIRKLYPKLPVIMFSTLSEHGAAITLEALSRGASDYLAKPTNTESLACAMEQVRSELSAKIFALSGRDRQVAVGTRTIALGKHPAGSSRIEILAIGTSTGGPNALADVIPRLPERFPVPVVVVQHMPPLFTRMLAERLNAQSRIPVHEGEQGRALEAGQVWIAPGDYHMTVAGNRQQAVLELNQDPPENSCRPAVDVLFRSVARIYGPNVLAVVMTGMGSDGARGAAQIRETGGEVFVQDEDSSVVWGMPGAVVHSGCANKICPLPEISQEIVRRVKLGRAQGTAGAVAAPE